MTDKFIRKYMKIAKCIADNNDSCYSRKIGSIIVNPESNTIIGTGYNGPPQKTPHTDSREYLEELFWPLLTLDEKSIGMTNIGISIKPEEIQENENIYKEKFCKHFSEKKICPRRLVDANSGCRLELCSCSHSEQNAITNAAQSTVGCFMFCWCGIPCIDCTKAIINSGIKSIYCILKPSDYSSQSRWLLKKAGIIIHIAPAEWYLEEIVNPNAKSEADLVT